MTIHPGVLVFEGLVERWRPPTPMPLSRWLTENIVLVDGDSAGRPWSAKGAPYLVEIADCLGDDHPCNVVTVRKSQQSGASILALGWCLYIADREPANTLFAAPSLDALRTLNAGKLQPLIDAWQRKTGRTVIRPQTSRSGDGSTTYEKAFPGGRLWLGNANAVMDLSSITVKKGVKDELSKWQDIPGYGDPENLFFGRFTAFRRRRNYKILEISTPEVDAGDPSDPGHCRIDRSFRQSDQRFWHCRCPGCGEPFVHTFKQFQVDANRPHKSFYPCPHCGVVIDDAARAPMIRDGFWRPTFVGEGRHPGFHIDAFVSLMMSYEAIAEDWIKAETRGEIGRKDFSTLVLGLPYEYRGDAPDHVRLLERREEGLKRGHIPPGGLFLTAAADVQMRGIWLEVVAWAPNRESWTVEARYLDGSTESPHEGAFAELAEWLVKEWPDAFGRKRRLDGLGVDSGYRSHVVYAWARKHQLINPNGANVIHVLKGMDGWGRPPLGTPSLVDIDLEGAKVTKGAKVWPVGTWPLKSTFYGDLAKAGRKAGASEDPSGYCHFGEWLDENYFRQLTAESLAQRTFRGRVRQEWRLSSAGRDNHFLDCRVYNMALIEHFGLSSFTPDEIAQWKRERGAPASDALPLFVRKAETGSRKPDGDLPGHTEKGPETGDERFARLMRENLGLFS